MVILDGDSRAIVGGFDGTFIGFDLSRMAMPPAAPTEQMTRLAEIAAGRRILSAGNVVPITTAEWTERWEQLPHADDALSRTPAVTPAPDRAGP